MSIEIDIMLSKGGVFKTLATSEILYQEGAHCNFYYQLINGRIKSVNINDSGKEFIQQFFEKGDSISDTSLFDDSTYITTTIAVESSTVIRLNKNIFLELLHKDPKCHFKFTKELAQKLRFKYLLSNELAFHTPEHRILTLINYLKSSQTNICNRCFQLQLTRQQLADMTGLRVETVIRVMRHLHETGKVNIDKGKVYCTDTDCFTCKNKKAGQLKE